MADEQVETLVVLRHACAGEKEQASAVDAERALDAHGHLIAEQTVAVLLRHLKPAAIWSSPLRRCIETVEPLAAAVELDTRLDERLAPAQGLEDVQRAFVEAPGDTVLCTHGEVIDLLFHHAVTCEKGAFWIVERTGGTLQPVTYVEDALHQVWRPVRPG
jgi:broad specificity phosphatase PhoE